MIRITGTTKLAGVIGWPLAHSLSPTMHNAVYDALGLDWAYVPLAVPDEMGLRRLVAAIRSMPFVGFNVTMPFKADVLELCDEVAMAARMAGAVNTVHCSDGKLIGYNTDSRGLLESLESDAGFNPAGKKAVIFGAGGAAGGAVVALILARTASITVVNRDVERAEELLDRMSAYTMTIKTDAVPYPASERAVREADLVINATSVGMKAEDPCLVPAEWLSSGQVVFDMVYGTPQRTALLTCGDAVGATTVDGLEMLVCQGATAVDIWNNSAQTRTPREVMRSAANDELVRRAGLGSSGQ